LSSIQTEKSKLLSVIQDNPHSEHSQRIEDEQFLQKVHPKAPIACLLLGQKPAVVWLGSPLIAQFTVGWLALMFH